MDIAYDEEGFEAAQADLLYQTATQQFEKLLPKLEKCGLDGLSSSINVGCTTQATHWQTFQEMYMWLNSDGTIGEWTSGCVREYLMGASMPVGKTHPGQWTVKFKILRTFKPNPDGGALCPYSGLVE